MTASRGTRVLQHLLRNNPASISVLTTFKNRKTVLGVSNRQKHPTSERPAAAVNPGHPHEGIHVLTTEENTSHVVSNDQRSGTSSRATAAEHLSTRLRMTSPGQVLLSLLQAVPKDVREIKIKVPKSNSSRPFQISLKAKVGNQVTRSSFDFYPGGGFRFNAAPRIPIQIGSTNEKRRRPTP